MVERIMVIAGYFVPILLIAALLWTAEEDIENIAEMPAELQDPGSTYCTVYDYRSCTAGDWFGIYRKQLPYLGKNDWYDTRFLKTMCMGQTTSGYFRRYIEQGDRELILCRLKEIAAIDRGAVLKQLESMQQ